MGVCWWERFLCDRWLCDLLLRLEVVFARPCRVPPLALLAALRMVHFSPIILPVTRHTDICDTQTPHQLSITFVMLQYLCLGESYPLNTEVFHTPQPVRWGLWCSTTDHRDRCWDSDKSSPWGLVLGTYLDKTYKGKDMHYWKCYLIL